MGRQPKCSLVCDPRLMASQIRRTIMCDSLEATTTSCCVPRLAQAATAAPPGPRAISRRAALGTLGASASALTAPVLLAGEGIAQAAPATDSAGLTVTLLGTNGGARPPPARGGVRGTPGP